MANSLLNDRADGTCPQQALACAMQVTIPDAWVLYAPGKG